MHKVKLIFKKENYLNDVQDIPRAFSPYLEIDENSSNYIQWDYCIYDGFFEVKVCSNIFGSILRKLDINSFNFDEYKKFTKRFLKNVLYDFISEKLNISLPYGSLTGVRPTKLYYELAENNINPVNILVEEFKVEKFRAEMVADCVANQKGIINNSPDRIGLFLNVPFCPTRCNYCSFISTEVFRIKNELPLYADCVLEEFNLLNEYLSASGKTIASIYVGGGTPTCIGLDVLEKLLTPLSNFRVEFTVEAGRPDTLSKEIIDFLKEKNVTRISINPQSFNEETLKKIGRKHTLKQFYEAFGYARETGFIINTDLIALLPGENFKDFCYSVDKALELMPENLTVHTLSLKRGSTLLNEGAKKNEFGLAKEMTNYAYSRLRQSGYLPYYMYRQKNMADNLENIGFCLLDCQCTYNIDMMEESQSIFGIGAGAMSKNIMNNKIQRFPNPKGFREYCERIKNTVSDKKKFFGV